MKTTMLLFVLTQMLCVVMNAQETRFKPAKVSFDDYKLLVSEVESHRAERLIDLNTFLEMSELENVIILDTRTKLMYDSRHIKGAQHLAFTDFTQESLRRLIPDPTTKILIYCNNNFEGDQINFASKMAVRKSVPGKPIMMALNIPTYINLYGYGYRNIYELSELVNVQDPRIQFEGLSLSGLLREPVVVNGD